MGQVRLPFRDASAQPLCVARANAQLSGENRLFYPRLRCCESGTAAVSFNGSSTRADEVLFMQTALRLCPFTGKVAALAAVLLLVFGAGGSIFAAGGAGVWTLLAQYR